MRMKMWKKGKEKMELFLWMNKRCSLTKTGSCLWFVLWSLATPQSGSKVKTRDIAGNSLVKTASSKCRHMSAQKFLYDLRRDLVSNDNIILFQHSCWDEQGSDAVESEGWNVLFYSTPDESWGTWQIITGPRPVAQSEKNRGESCQQRVGTSLLTRGTCLHTHARTK